MPWVPSQDGQGSVWVMQTPEGSAITPPVPTEDSTPSVWSQQTPEGAVMNETQYQATVSAQQAAASALLYRNQAEGFSISAGASQTAAALSASAAAGSALTAAADATAAETARTQAQTARTNAETAETNAETAAAAAAASAAAANLFNPALYATKAAPFFTGNPTIENGAPALTFRDTSALGAPLRGAQIAYEGMDGELKFRYLNDDGSLRVNFLTFDAGGNTVFGQSVDFFSNMMVRASYFHGGISFHSGGETPGTPRPGYMKFFAGEPDYEDVGYIGDKLGTNQLGIVAQNGWGWRVVGDTQFTDKVTLYAADTVEASLRIPNGVAPTTPEVGDIYTGTTGFFCYLNGVWREVAWRNIDNTFTGKLITKTTDANGAGLNIPPTSTAPTSPVNGDIWTTSGEIIVRLNGASRNVAFRNVDTSILAKYTFAASTASKANFNLAPGVDLTSGWADGDFWTVGGAVKARLSGATRTFILDNDTRLTDARAPTAHTHAIADLPVATSGTSNTTQVVRADDTRLSNARAPTAHTHAIADLPVAASGVSDATKLARSDDIRLSGAVHGQCRIYLDAGVIKLSRYGGDRLKINGVTCTIPSTPVTSGTPAAEGLAATTTYYVYAMDTNADGVVDDLEFSTVGYVVDVATPGNAGVAVKSGDSTRTLVGMVRTNGSNVFADSDAERYVLNWFNRKPIGVHKTTTATQSFTFTAWNNIGGLTAGFIAWGDEPIFLHGTGNVASNGAGNFVYYGVSLDNAAPTYCRNNARVGNAGYETAVSCFGHVIPSQGYHLLSLMSGTSGGTASILDNYSHIGAIIMG